MESDMEVTQKIKNRTTMLLSNATSECKSKANEIGNTHRYLLSHVHCNIIDNNQDTGVI